jgi:uncharacterized C2H2 Zn-finger protein
MEEELLNNLQCPLCQYRATRRSHLIRHINTLHNPYPFEYRCGDCGFVTKRNDKLKQHVKRHAAAAAGLGGVPLVHAKRGRKPKNHALLVEAVDT